MIVIIGVYTAFLIQTYAEGQKTNKERDVVLTALKFELESFRYRMYENALSVERELVALRKVKANGSYADFSNYRFIAPQYDYQTIEYALGLQNREIIDFELYRVLQALFSNLKRIEHAERLLTETSLKYKTVPTALDQNSTDYRLIDTENRDNFVLFITFTEDRGRIAGRIVAASVEALPLINTRLGEKKAKAIEEEIILNNLDKVNSEDEAVILAKQLFPKFTEEEIRQLYRNGRSDR